MIGDRESLRVKFFIWTDCVAHEVSIIGWVVVELMIVVIQIVVFSGVIRIIESVLIVLIFRQTPGGCSPSRVIVVVVGFEFVEAFGKMTELLTHHFHDLGQRIWGGRYSLVG